MAREVDGGGDGYGAQRRRPAGIRGRSRRGWNLEELEGGLGMGKLEEESYF